MRPTSGPSSAALDPALMGLGPISACKQLIMKSKLSVQGLDLIEINDSIGLPCSRAENL